MVGMRRTGKPSVKEGRENSIEVRKEFDGSASIYSKFSGMWRKIGLNVLTSPSKGSLSLFATKNEIYHDSRLLFYGDVLDFNCALKLGDINAATSDTDKFLVSDSGTIKYRTGSEVLSDIGGSSTTGTVTEVTGGTGIDVLNGTTTPAITVDLGELPDGTGSVVGSADEMIYLDNGAQKRKQIDEIKLSQFANDLDAFAIAGGITAGAVIWQYLPFHIQTATNGRYYYVDTDGYGDSARKWDSYDTDPTGFNYRAVAGNFVVPEDCTLVAMHGVIANQSSTNNPTITIYHGTITEAGSDTTLASAGGVTPTTGTMRVPFKFSKTDFDTDLTAGDIVVPTVSHADSGGTRTFTGSLTLKFITR